MRPPSITATRSQIVRMTCISWVISTMVSPSWRLMSSSRRRMDCVVSGSSAEVASSHSRICGRLASARAMPTRCFCPPDSCDGYLWPCSESPTSASSSFTLAARSAAFVCPVAFSGQSMLSATVLALSRLKCWKIMPTRRRSAYRPSLSSVVMSSPSISTRPAEGRSSRFSVRISVLLPAPERPMMPKTSPAPISRLTSASAATSRPSAAR